MTLVNLDEFIEGLEPRERDRLALDDPQLKQTFDSFDKIETLFAKVRLPSRMESLANETPEFALTGFTKIRLLGEGTFGAVFLAHDHRLERQVAIKVPRTRWRATGNTDRFVQEAKLAAKLTHPGIVPLHELIEENDTCFLVSEFVEGGTLEEQLQSQPLAHDAAVRITLQLAEALEYAHRANIVHRDLKPSNILMDECGNPRITDFGLAILDNDQAASLDHVAGTIEYMSPERLPGENRYLDGRADVWSLGVVLYRMLTRRLPFGGRSREELFREIRDRSPKPLKQIDASVPHALQDICLKCLEKDPADRFSSASEVVTQLRQYMYPSRTPKSSATRFSIVAVASFACIGLTAMAIQSFRPPQASTEPIGESGPLANPSATATTARPFVDLRVETMRVRHFRYDENDHVFDLGTIGLSSQHVRFGDDVRIELKFNRPAHFYLLECTSQGEIKLHASSRTKSDDRDSTRENSVTGAEVNSEENIAAKMATNTRPSPSLPVATVEFPPESGTLGVEDGIGVHAFVVVASVEPLPPFDQWRARMEPLTWSNFNSEGIWRYENNGFEDGHFMRQRGTVRNHVRPPQQFETLCKQLTGHDSRHIVHALAFPVHARGPSEPAND